MQPQYVWQMSSPAGSKPREFLKALQLLVEEPFEEVEALAVDDPKTFWQKSDLTAESPQTDL